MKCPRCQAENPPGLRFCGQRATPLDGSKGPRFAAPGAYTPKHLAEQIINSKTALEGEPGHRPDDGSGPPVRGHGEPGDGRRDHGPLRGAAHCHLGPGKLYCRTDRRKETQEHLATATTRYREMGMTYWLEKAEAEIAG